VHRFLERWANGSIFTRFGGKRINLKNAAETADFTNEHG